MSGDTLAEPFSERRDAEHPVTWQPADGDTPAYITLKGACERLAGYGHDPEAARRTLLDGHPIRTPFAFYRIDRS